MEKRCIRCGKLKDLDEFYERAYISDGRSSYCKACTSEVNKEYRAKRKLENGKYSEEQIAEGKVLLLKEAAEKPKTRCVNCPLKEICRERISKGLWLLCEIPDKADIRRVAASGYLVRQLEDDLKVDFSTCRNLAEFARQVDELYLEDVK